MICFQTLFFLILITTAAAVTAAAYSCDLLSNFVLSNFDNNITIQRTDWNIVVICFQTLFFLILITTQHWLNQEHIRCDLLSNFVLSNFDNNFVLAFVACTKVVICFQTLFFLILITTNGTNKTTHTKL